MCVDEFQVTRPDMISTISISRLFKFGKVINSFSMNLKSLFFVQFPPIHLGKQAVLVLSCDNPHMSDDVMVEPGLVMIFAHGVE